MDAENGPSVRVHSVMVQHPASSDSLPLTDDQEFEDRTAIPNFAAERERTEWLIKTLGEPACRRLGVYRIPEDFVLSVVIPVYNEQNTIHSILTRVRAVPIRKQIIIVDD